MTGPSRAVVTALLEIDWSPEQIATMLPNLYPDDSAMRMIHETIYQSMFVQTGGELTAYLHTSRSARLPRG